jgi:thiamine biosynthesis protein ThiS
VTVQLNGEAREAPEGLSVTGLIEWMKLPLDRVAVERNVEIVPRARWSETFIQVGDRLEVVHLIGGGLEAGFAPAPSQGAPAGAPPL